MIILAMLIICITPHQVQARTHIGDEIPAEKYQIGNGPDISCELEAEFNSTPMFYPEWAKDRLTWTAYPYSAYYFRSAPTEGANFFSGKISDAGAGIANSIANLLFMGTKFCTTVGNNLLITCFDDGLLKNTLSFVMGTVKEIESTASDAMKVIFYLALAGLGVSVSLLLLRAQVMRALSSVLISILLLAGSMIYVDNIENIIPPTVSCLNNLTGVLMMATSGLQDYTPEGSAEDNLAEAKIEITDTSDISTLGASMINMTNIIWFATVSGPWANGQFGTSDYSRLKMTAEEKEKVNDSLNRKGASERYKTLQSEYIDTNYLASSEDVKEPLLAAITSPDIDHGEHAITLAASGAGEQNANRHITAAFWSIFPAAAFLVLMALVGLPVFASQILLMGLLFILPFAFMTGIAGDRGKEVTLKFIEWTLGALSTKVIYGFYLGLVMMVAIIAMKFAETNTGLSGFLLFIIFGAAACLRKRYFNLVISLISLTPGKETTSDPFKTFMRMTLLKRLLRRSGKQLRWKNQEENKGKKNKKENESEKEKENGESTGNKEGSPPRTPNRTQNHAAGKNDKAQKPRSYSKEEKMQPEANRNSSDESHDIDFSLPNHEQALGSNQDTQGERKDANYLFHRRRSDEKNESELENNPFPHRRAYKNNKSDIKVKAPWDKTGAPTPSSGSESPQTQNNNPDVNHSTVIKANSSMAYDKQQSHMSQGPLSNNTAEQLEKKTASSLTNRREDSMTSKEPKADKSSIWPEYKNQQRAGADIEDYSESDDDSLWQRRRQLRENYLNDVDEQPQRKKQREDPPWRDKEY